MKNRIIKKLLYSLITIFLCISAIFFALRLTPGDPVERILGPEATKEEISRYRDQLGLDLPTLTQYKNFLKGAVTGELGKSLYKKKPVIDLVVTHMTPSLVLGMVAVFFSTIIGIIVGTISAAKKSQIHDHILRLGSLFLLSIPVFSMAPILVLIFSIQFNLLPVSEWGQLKHLILPATTLILPLSAIISRVMRTRYLEEYQSPWVRVLHAKGLSPMAIHLRIVKVSLTSVFNIVAIQLSVVLAGTMITEAIFDIPGIGLLLFESIQNRDYPIIQGVILYSSIIYIASYFLIELLNEYIDPRIKSEA
jgi:peptide/nickel transport system permease protein